MFTGLVEGIGELVERKPTSGGFRLRIGSPLAPELKPGDSLAVNGVCLTVILAERDEIHADVGPETVRVTTLGTIARGSALNLERPLRADQRFGGHFVQGHVDDTGTVVAGVDPRHGGELVVRVPAGLVRYCAVKGSIALDGVSLTIAALRGDELRIAVIPHTAQLTTVGAMRAGDPVHVEVDMLAKYVERMIARE
jgi:riboflavin synthase